jgi:hypothetical protein
MVGLAFATQLERADTLETTNLHIGAPALYSTSLGSRQTQDAVRDLELGNLATPNSVQKLQRALHAKAKALAGYRFYALYDKIYREDILAHAYAQCRSNQGAPGVDA